MAWTVEYAEAAERDFDLIFDHLHAAYLDLGEDADTAFRHAGFRIRQLKSEIDRLAGTPHIGTLRPDMGDHVRFVRRDNAAIWFRTDEPGHRLEVLAIFFGAQDHIRYMLVRQFGSND